MMKQSLLLAVVLLAAACGKKEDTASKPVTCAVAGQMVTKRLGEFADEAKVTGERRTKLDTALAAKISERCTADAWDEVVLGCLGALATIKEGEVDAKTYNKGIDICTKAIGDANQKKLDESVGEVIRTVGKPE